MRFPSFCYSCVKLVLAHRLHLGGPRGITITNVYVHMLPCKRDSQSRHSRLSSLFYLLSTPVHSPPQEKQKKGSRAEGTYFQNLTVNKWGYSCCLFLPYKRFLFWCREFYELPLSLALNHNILQICESMSQFGDESPLTITLIYEWYIWGFC